MNKNLLFEFEECINEYIKTNDKFTPIIGYYGGKQNLVNDILKILPDHNSYSKYIEPFAGGAALFFAKPLSKFNALNEINGELTNMYIQMQLHKEEFIACAEKLTNSQILHRYKRRYNQIKSNFTKAVILFYIINTSYNHKIYGGYAFGKSRNHTEFYNKKVRELSVKIDKLKYANIFNKDAIEIIKLYDDSDVLFYLDPPYPETDQGHYKGYSYKQFEELLYYLANDIKGKFVLSCFYKNIEKYKDLLSKFNIKILEKNLYAYKLDKNTKDRPRKLEVLIYNYDNI